MKLNAAKHHPRTMEYAKKKPGDGEKPQEFRSLFHDDSNLQDEQAEFDAANPPGRQQEAIKRLFEYWENREKEKQPPSEDTK